MRKTEQERGRARRTRMALAGTVAALAVGAAALAQAGKALYINGNLATRDVRTIGGRDYVPVADVAKALGLQVSRRPGGGTELIAAGGANQIAGSKQGKIGDELFTGEWRFQVKGVSTADKYRERYFQKQGEVKPQGANDQLLIVECRIKNGTRKTRDLYLTEVEKGNTALADTQGRSYAPLDYDARQPQDYKNSSGASSPVLPGAAVDFAIVFSVPKDAQPKDLIFSILTRTDGVKDDKATDVRVSLAP